LSDQLQYSVFHDVFFPNNSDDEDADVSDLTLERVIRFKLNPDHVFKNLPMVVFDFETTGLDSKVDHIIEVGAVRLEQGKPVAEFSELINPGMALSEQVVNITGITDKMLEGQPTIDQVLGNFIDFFKGAVLVAHNAEFDMGFLTAACRKQGWHLQWPAFCTLKMARQVLPQLESRNLDTLAEHYELEFEARHRSIGDVKVTVAVMEEMLADMEVTPERWDDLKDFYVVRS